MARGVWPPKGPKSILYKPSRVAYQNKGNEKKNIVVQKFCPGGMSSGHQRGKSRILDPFFVILSHFS